MLELIVTKGAARASFPYQIVFTQTLLWCIWEIVLNLKSTPVKLHPTLMPPEYHRYMANFTVREATISFKDN